MIETILPRLISEMKSLDVNQITLASKVTKIPRINIARQVNGEAVTNINYLQQLIDHGFVSLGNKPKRGSEVLSLAKACAKYRATDSEINDALKSLGV